METEVNTSKRDPFYVLGVPEYASLSPVDFAREEVLRLPADHQHVPVAFIYHPEDDAVEPYSNFPGGTTLTRDEFRQLVDKVWNFYARTPSDGDILHERLEYARPRRDTSSRLHVNKQLGFVYLFRLDQERLYKIGATTNDPVARSAEVARIMKRPVTILHQFISDDIFWAEWQLHRRFHKQVTDIPKGGREWFSLDDDDVDLILRIHRFEGGDWIVSEQPS